MHAVKNLQEDEAFKLDTERVKAAVEAAKKVETWVKSNTTESAYFEDKLLQQMKKCMVGGVSSVLKREKVWGKFHSLRVSQGYINFWKVFLEIIGCGVPDPAFYQHVSQHIFTSLLKDMFPVPDVPSTSTSTAVSSLDFNEKSAIRYVAGYVCQKLYRKMKKLGNNDICQGIEDMIHDELDEPDEESTTWTKLIDRGGLFKVNDRVYAFFVSIELVVRHFYQLKKATELQPGMKDLLVASVLQDDDVELQWSLLSLELEEKDKRALMNMIINDWINIRGFSFAGSYVELYKQATRKSLQKSKALRTKLSDAKKKKKKSSQQ